MAPPGTGAGVSRIILGPAPSNNDRIAPIDSSTGVLKISEIRDSFQGA